MPDDFKRQTAYKIRIGEIFKGKQIMDGDRFSFLELGDRKIARVNIVANVIEKYTSDEKQYIALTIDDASGQIRIKIFGDDVLKFSEIGQGDTILVIGMLRIYNDEIYITPEVFRKQDPRYLMVRKLEFEKSAPAPVDNKKIIAVADKIIQKVKEAESEGGISIDKIITDLGEDAVLINQEIRKALEQGILYEPRPGLVRYLGID